MLIIELLKWIFWALVGLWVIVSVGGVILLGILKFHWYLKEKKEN